MLSALAAMGALFFAWRTIKEAREARREAGDQAEQQIAAMAVQVRLMNEANEAAVRQHKIELGHRHVEQLGQLAELLVRARDAATKAGKASQVERSDLSLGGLLWHIQLSVAALTASGYTCPPTVIDVVLYSGRQDVDPMVIESACAAALLDITDVFSKWSATRTKEIAAGKGWTE